MVLLCCDFTIFASWRDKKYQNILEKKKLFYTNGIIDEL
jgi:hypothetical protein